MKYRSEDDLDDIPIDMGLKAALGDYFSLLNKFLNFSYVYM